MRVQTKKAAGFTMVELLVALLVASIVLAAVSTLANATTLAKQATDDMGRSQAELRIISGHLTDLIQRANLVIDAYDDGFTLWHDVNSDGLNTYEERTQVLRGDGGDTLSVGDMTFNRCTNIEFGYDVPATDTLIITVWFSLTENGVTNDYSVSARLHCSDKYKDWVEERLKAELNE